MILKLATLGNVARFINRSPMLRTTTLGAATGAIVGAATAPQGHRINHALGGAVIGGGISALGMALHDALNHLAGKP